MNFKNYDYRNDAIMFYAMCLLLELDDTRELICFSVG